MADLKTGVLLTLKDNFSAAMSKAGNASKNFADKTLGALNKVDSALSGTAAKLGAFGVSLSIGAAAKEIIDLDAKMMRIGVQANVSAEKVNQLKQKIFETAQAPDIKIGTDDLVTAMDAVIERTGDLKFVDDNLRAIGLAIQATGASGEAIGGLYAEFQKMGLGAKEAMEAIDTLTVQGKEGAFTLQNLAALGPRTISAYTATGRTGTAALREMGAALQVIRMGTGSSEQAATAFEAVMRNLTSPDKIKGLEAFGVQVKDQNGFRSIVDIMQDIVEKSQGNTELLGQVFDAEAMRAFNFAIGEFKRTGAVTSFAKFNEIVGDGSVIQADSARNATTLSANLKNLQTAFVAFADKNLTKPLQLLTEQLNKLAENPEAVEKVFYGIAAGLGAIVAIKGLATVVNLLSGLKNLRGGKIDIGASGGMGAMPVYVTNWGGGGAGAASGMPQSQTIQPMLNQGNWRTNATSAVRNLTGKQYAGGAAAGGIGAAFVAIPQMFNELDQIKQDTTMSESEKTVAKGGAIGDASGSIVGGIAGGAAGVAAGAAVGAAVGSVVPVLGTAIGALVGAGVGALGMWLGGKAGRAIGEGIAGATVEDNSPKATIPEQSFAGVSAMPQYAQTPDPIVVGTEITVRDDRIIARTTQNGRPMQTYQHETGRASVARGMP